MFILPFAVAVPMRIKSTATFAATIGDTKSGTLELSTDFPYLFLGLQVLNGADLPDVTANAAYEVRHEFKWGMTKPEPQEFDNDWMPQRIDAVPVSRNAGQTVMSPWTVFPRGTILKWDAKNLVAVANVVTVICRGWRIKDPAAFSRLTGVPI